MPSDVPRNNVVVKLNKKNNKKDKKIFKFKSAKCLTKI